MMKEIIIEAASDNNWNAIDMEPPPSNRLYNPQGTTYLDYWRAAVEEVFEKEPNKNLKICTFALKLFGNIIGVTHRHIGINVFMGISKII